MGALTLKGLTQPVVAFNVPLAASQPAGWGRASVTQGDLVSSEGKVWLE